jgi:hypothetical protein
MIWDPTIIAGEQKSVIASYIMDELGEVCGRDLVVNPSNVEELARAIESFLKHNGNPSVIDSKYLVMLASRALSSIGEKQAAQRLLLFGTGLIKPAEWEITSGKSMWVLDLKQMTVKNDVFLELIFLNSLHIILESIADIWDESDGHGVLGLRNVCCVGSSLLGAPGKTRKLSSLAGEIKRLCDRKLEQIGDARGWSEFPHVMNLDM